MKARLMLILFFMSLVLSGCWDWAELKNRILITGLSIDTYKDGYSLGMEVISFTDGSSQGQSPSGKPYVLTTTFPFRSIERPLHIVTDRLSGEPFYPNVRILVFSEQVAKTGIADAISHFIRDPDMRRTTEVVITPHNASELLKIKAPHKGFNSIYLSTLVESSVKTGRTISSDVGDVSRAVHEGAVSLIPLVMKGKDEKEAKIMGTAVLQKGKWIGKLSMDESVAVNYSLKKVSKGSLFTPCWKGKGAISTDLISVKSTIKPVIQHGKLLITIDMKVTGYLSEYTCYDENESKNTSLENIEKIFDKKLDNEFSRDLTAALHRTGVDILNIKEILEKKPAQWKKIEHHFPDMIRQAEVRVKASTELKLKGTEA